MSTTTDTPTVEQLLALGKAGHVIVSHVIGLSGAELAALSPEAVVALAWVSFQTPDVIKGVCDLIHAAKQDAARTCARCGGDR